MQATPAGIMCFDGDEALRLEFESHLILISTKLGFYVVDCQDLFGRIIVM